MLMGAATGLLVFAGFWRTFEWFVHGRNRGSVRLIPGGAAYLILGVLIALGTGGTITAWVALVVALASLIASFAMRNHSQVRRWVVWLLIIIDAAIVSALLTALAS